MTKHQISFKKSPDGRGYIASNGWIIWQQLTRAEMGVTVWLVSINGYSRPVHSGLLSECKAFIRTRSQEINTFNYNKFVLWGY